MWKIFSETVKEKVGVIIANVFRSDDDPSFYNGLIHIMDPAKHQLLCSWHVDQTWRWQIQQKVRTGKETVALMYKSLKVVQGIPDVSTFEHSLALFTDELLDNEHTQEFGQYLLTWP